MSVYFKLKIDENEDGKIKAITDGMICFGHWETDFRKAMEE